jgi:hypothetical protein
MLKNSTFWDTKLCSPLKINQHFEGACGIHLHSCFLLGLLFNLEVEATFSFEKLVAFQQITQCFIPENRALNKHRYENLKSHAILFTQEYYGINKDPGELVGKLERKLCLKNLVDKFQATN